MYRRRLLYTPNRRCNYDYRIFLRGFLMTEEQMNYDDFDEVMEDIRESIINEKLEQLIYQLGLEDKFER